MARILEITVPTGRTESIVSRLRETNGLLGLRVQRGVSLQPAGDVITAQTTTRAPPGVMQMRQREGIGTDSTDLTTSEPMSVVSRSHAPEISTDSSEATWEEMDYNLNKESRM